MNDEVPQLLSDITIIKERVTELEHDVAELKKQFSAHKGEVVTLTSHVTTLSADMSEVLAIARNVKLAVSILLFTKTAAVWMTSVGGALAMIYVAMSFMFHGLKFMPVTGG